VKLKLGVAVGLCQKIDVVEIPDEDVEGLSDKAQEEMFSEWLEGHVSNHVNSWWEVVAEE
jgi:hypothetical protein